VISIKEKTVAKAKKKASKTKKSIKKKVAKKKAAKRPGSKKAVKKKPVKKKAAKKKTAKKKPVKKIRQAKPLPPPAVEGILLGRVEDFFAHINVVAVTLKSALRVGNVIRIKGHTTDLTENVTSIQVEHEAIEEAKKGDSVGIKISGIARKRDWVFRVD